MAADLACDALRMAWFRGRRLRGVIVRTDRGSQYCSRAIRDLAGRFNARQRMNSTIPG
jgi:transposase InsO family protein